jgi:hypothetical protein
MEIPAGAVRFALPFLRPSMYLLPLAVSLKSPFSPLTFPLFKYFSSGPALEIAAHWTASRFMAVTSTASPSGFSAAG